MKLKINELKPNKDNPRIIKDHKFKKLTESIKEFPEMLELRPIVVDENMTILGGNMRYRASVEAGLKEVYVKVAKGLTDEQKQEFIVKDNVSFGEWDWSTLGNKWKTNELDNWGLDVWQNYDDNVNKVNSGDENSEWVGMPEFESKEDTLKIIVHFTNENDRNEFAEEHKLKFMTKLSKTWSTSHPYKERKDLSSLTYE